MIEEKKDNKTIKLLILIIAIVGLSIGGYFGYKALNNKESSGEKEVVEAKITPLLYEVTKEGSDNKMYLFGSIHAAKKSELVFPKYVMDAYNNSHYLACEADLVAYQSNQEAIQEDALKMLYQDGTSIKDHLSTETYNKLINFLTEKKLYNNIYEMYKPFFFQSLISNLLISDSGLSATSGIDNYFLKKAKADNKTILEVESIAFQTDMLLSFSDELYDLQLSESVDHYDESVTMLSGLYNAWKTGNIEEIIRYSEDDLDVLDSYTEEQKKMAEKYNKVVVYDRNNAMTKKAMEYFDNNQDVFFMVGSLHILGDTGLAKQLEQNGYIVKQVS